ncbi:cation diffusion facilitator family transporter [uncultured Alistipes sp.]|uniref:cation diffusion facilitator family transporter n=1 Tax=uncultured Alistipes sp. TaxID=538949 RepID=UPI0026155C8A|nr:cation diffusion facilitator family transporter [uncultured Alistipes sp.]
MPHAHAHHPHPSRTAALNRAFAWGIALNVAFVAAECVAGLWYGSIGLLSDAGHNLSDVAGLVLALVAFRLARRRPTARYTYGYKKSTVLISLLNSLLLLLAAVAIVVESILRLRHPVPVVGAAVAWTAGAGVAINGFTAWLFMKERRHDLNVRGAYLHMAADALVSAGVVISGVVIGRTGWTPADPIAGLVVAAVIVASGWSLLRDSLRLALDGVPADIDPGRLEALIAAEEGVAAVHHLHVWAVSTTENALTVHVAVGDLARLETIRRRLRERLREEGVAHATFEFETAGAPCTGCGEGDE